MADINERLDRLQRREEFDRLGRPLRPAPAETAVWPVVARPAGVDDRLGEVLDAVAAVVRRHAGLSVMVAVADGRAGRPVIRVTERNGSVETGVVVVGSAAPAAVESSGPPAGAPEPLPARDPVYELPAAEATRLGYGTETSRSGYGSYDALSTRAAAPTRGSVPGSDPVFEPSFRDAPPDGLPSRAATQAPAGANGRHAATPQDEPGAGWSGSSWHHALWSPQSRDRFREGGEGGSGRTASDRPWADRRRDPAADDRLGDTPLGNGGPRYRPGEDRPGDRAGQDQLGDDRRRDRTAEDRPRDRAGQDLTRDRTAEDRPHDRAGQDLPRDRAGADRPWADRPRGDLPRRDLPRDLPPDLPRRDLPRDRAGEDRPRDPAGTDGPWRDRRREPATADRLREPASADLPRGDLPGDLPAADRPSADLPRRDMSRRDVRRDRAGEDRLGGARSGAAHPDERVADRDERPREGRPGAEPEEGGGSGIPLPEDTSQVVSRLAQLLRENPTLAANWSREAQE